MARRAIPATEDQIKATFTQNRSRENYMARLSDCLRLTAEWHNRFGETTTLDNKRFRALCQRLVDAEIDFDSIYWSFEAYFQDCRTNPWHHEGDRHNPNKLCLTDAHKTMIDFLNDKHFEKWVRRGKELRAKLDFQGMPMAGPPPAQLGAIYERYLALPAERRRELLDRAEADLLSRRRRVTHDATKAMIARYLLSEPELLGNASVEIPAPPVPQEPPPPKATPTPAEVYDGNASAISLDGFTREQIDQAVIAVLNQLPPAIYRTVESLIRGPGLDAAPRFKAKVRDYLQSQAILRKESL